MVDMVLKQWWEGLKLWGQYSSLRAIATPLAQEASAGTHFLGEAILVPQAQAGASVSDMQPRQESVAAWRLATNENW